MKTELQDEERAYRRGFQQGLNAGMDCPEHLHKLYDDLIASWREGNIESYEPPRHWQVKVEESSPS